MRPLRIAVVGSGFGGIAAVIALRRAGFEDIVVFERALDVGGVWRDNDYPGSACDVPTHLYSFSYAQKRNWSHLFAEQAEIHQYLRDVADRFDVRRLVRFGTEVLRGSFDEATGRWTLDLPGGVTYEADLVVAACGQLSQPSYPALPGLQQFTGTSFHSARWDHGHDLTGRHVAVIGTGASAIQFVPRVAQVAATVTVFQREPAYVMPKPDAELSAPVPLPVTLSRRWRTYWYKELTSVRFNHYPVLFRRPERAWRRWVEQEVPDPRTRTALTPKDRMGCKRILVSNAWYATFRRPNTRLVTGAVAQVRPGAVVTAAGEEYPVDTIIFGTGFRATEFLAPMVLRGRGGADLAERWRDGARAYLGMAVPDFPNLFLMYGPNTNLGHNSLVFMLECQARYIAQAARSLAAGGAAWMHVRGEVDDVFDREIQRRSARTVFADGCGSWYRSPGGRFTANWPGSTVGYRLRTRRLRTADYHYGPAAAGQRVTASAPPASR